MFRFVRLSLSLSLILSAPQKNTIPPHTPSPHNPPKRTEQQQLTRTFKKPKSLDPVTLFHNPTLTSSKHALTILKQASTIASETATEDQASDYTNHAKKQQAEFQLEVSEQPPTSDQLRSILDYVAANGNGGAKKKTYVPGEIVKGARDAEDALKRFKEDSERFVRPIVCPPFTIYFVRGGGCVLTVVDCRLDRWSCRYR